MFYYKRKPTATEIQISKEDFEREVTALHTQKHQAATGKSFTWQDTITTEAGSEIAIPDELKQNLVSEDAIAYVNLGFPVGIVPYVRDGYTIGEGQIIGLYAGLQKTNLNGLTPQEKNYCQSIDNITLSIQNTVSAFEAGNVTRFVAHAPSARSKFMPPDCLSANTLHNTIFVNVNGNIFDLALIKASQDIPAGTLITRDYVNEFMEGREAIHFINNDGSLGPQITADYDKQEKIYQFKIACEFFAKLNTGDKTLIDILRDIFSYHKDHPQKDKMIFFRSQFQLSLAHMTASNLSAKIPLPAMDHVRYLTDDEFSAYVSLLSYHLTYWGDEYLATFRAAQEKMKHLRPDHELAQTHTFGYIVNEIETAMTRVKQKIPQLGASTLIDLAELSDLWNNNFNSIFLCFEQLSYYIQQPIVQRDRPSLCYQGLDYSEERILNAMKELVGAILTPLTFMLIARKNYFLTTGTNDMLMISNFMQQFSSKISNKSLIQDLRRQITNLQNYAKLTLSLRKAWAQNNDSAALAANDSAETITQKMIAILKKNRGQQKNDIVKAIRPLCKQLLSVSANTEEQLITICHQLYDVITDLNCPGLLLDIILIIKNPDASFSFSDTLAATLERSGNELPTETRMELNNMLADDNTISSPGDHPGSDKPKKPIIKQGFFNSAQAPSSAAASSPAAIVTPEKIDPVAKLQELSSNLGIKVKWNTPRNGKSAWAYVDDKAKDKINELRNEKMSIRHSKGEALVVIQADNLQALDASIDELLQITSARKARQIDDKPTAAADYNP